VGTGLLDSESIKGDTTMIELRKSVPVVADVDVLIVGTGIAGSTAAVAAGRNGAKTISSRLPSSLLKRHYWK